MVCRCVRELISSVMVCRCVREHRHQFHLRALLQKGSTHGECSLSGLLFRGIGFIGKGKARSCTRMLLRKRSTHGECSLTGLLFRGFGFTDKKNTRFRTHMLRAQAVFFFACARKPWRLYVAAVVWRCMRSRRYRCLTYSAAVAVTLRRCLDSAHYV